MVTDSAARPAAPHPSRPPSPVRLLAGRILWAGPRLGGSLLRPSCWSRRIAHAVGLLHNAPVASPRAPVHTSLRRAQTIFLVGALLPVLLTAPIGIILLTVEDSRVVDVVAGVLLLTFCTSAVVGCAVGWLFLHRGAVLARNQQEFLAAVSHELRTPMTSMRMFVEALEDPRLTDSAERVRCLTKLRSEVDRLDGLLGRLIELSRLESMPKKFGRDLISVDALVETASAAVDQLRAQHGAAIPIDLEVTPGLELMGDRDAIVQTLVNLLGNALKHGGADNHVRLVVVPHGEREIELAVIDRGPGIPVSERATVFEKFRRGRVALESGSQGSGLGLAIVQRVVEAHGGRIELRDARTNEDGQGVGCAFHVFLPRVRRSRAGAPQPQVS